MGHQHNTLSTLPLRVRKRDGVEVRFDAAKIESAIRRAGQASGEFGIPEASLLTAQVVKVLAHRYGADRLPDIEGIQDVVEQTLISANHFETARSYIVYREQHKKLRDEQRTLVDVGGSINEYLDRSDWRVAANANQGYSLGGLILNTSGKMIANYWLSHVYPPEIGQAHRDGDIHIHDLDMLSGYCAGWSLRTLLNEGLNGVPGKVEAGPPKHMSSAIGQIVNFLGTLQNEWAGAQAFSSFDTYMAPFVRVDGLDYPHVKQAIQELIYNLNVPSRWGAKHLYQSDLRLGLPGGPARTGAGDRGRGATLHLRRSPGGDGPDQPGLYRGDDRGRREGADLHLPDPDLQHHLRFPVGERERRAPVRDDGEVRPALLPELPELRPRPHGAIHVLVGFSWIYASCSSAATALRLGRADRLAGVVTINARGRITPIAATRWHCGAADALLERRAQQPQDQTQGRSSVAWTRLFPDTKRIRVPCATPFPPSG